MNIRLVAADLDNTLAPTGQPLPPRNREALIELHKRGIDFVLASGKNLYSLNRVETKWNLPFRQPYVMGMNGAELLDNRNNRTYVFEQLTCDVLKEIYEMMLPFGLNPFVYYQDGMLAEHDDEMLNASSLRNELKIYYTEVKGPVWSHPTAKILYRIPQEMVPEVRKFILDHPCEKWGLVQTQKNMLEFVHPETSKGHTLKRICEMNDIPLEEVMAFGDSENDEEMLKCCHGICLLDGFDSTKRVSEDITYLDCKDGGFGDYLFRHVLL